MSQHPRGGLKATLLASLVAVNVFLLVALLTAGGALPTASAQPGGRGGGNYLCVTAKAAGQSYDVSYVLDQSGQQLHAFHPGQGQNRQLTRTEPRDLARDFGK